MALDPEFVDIGVGAVFSKYLYFRPRSEFNYGEVTTPFWLNGEVTYDLPMNVGALRPVYFGARTALNFLETQQVTRR